MGKYSDIVKSKGESNKPENQKAINTDNQEAVKVENIKTGNTDNQKTRKVESNKTSNTDNQKTKKVENIKTGNADNQEAVKEEMVNLSIKVPRRLRQKWVAESRLRGTTLTAIITDYLSSELGE